MKHSVIKIGFLALALATVVACGKKGADGASVNTARDQRATGPSILPTGQGSTAGSQSANIIFNESQKLAMRETIQVLVSPTMDATAVGEIQSIEVTANVPFLSTGQVAGDTAFQMIIRDTYVGQTEDGATIEPIIIRIRGGGTGTVMNGQANLSFADEYGVITVKGTYNQTTFTGVVEFANKTVGFNNKRTGTIGQFSIPSCAFFRCN